MARGLAISCGLIAIGFSMWRGSIASGFAVLGGGGLIAISFWAIARTVDDLVLRFSSETGQKTAIFTLVKFFTRHGIVALAAYGMIVRLHLDPLGLLAGVTSLGVAVGLEAFRDVRWRRFL